LVYYKEYFIIIIIIIIMVEMGCVSLEMWQR